MQDPFCMLNPGGIQGIQKFGCFDTFSMTTQFLFAVCKNFFLEGAGELFSQVWPSLAWSASTGQH